MKTILVFGSEDFDYDNKAVNMIDLLKKKLTDHAIYKLSRPEQIMDFLQKDFIILDVAKGINKPVMITDLDKIKYGKKITAHDMDLAAFLKTLKELRQIDKIKIVAIPNDKETNVEEVAKMIMKFT